MTELGYPTSAEEMGRRLAGISADPSYVTLVAEREGWVVVMAEVHLERTNEANGEVVRICCPSSSARKTMEGASGEP